MKGQYDQALFEARRLTAEARHRLAVQILAEMNPGTEDWLRDLARSGICGEKAPTFTERSEQMLCTLPAKHEGWHHDMHSGGHWSGAA